MVGMGNISHNIVVSNTNIDCLSDFLGMLLPLAFIAVLVTLSVAYYKDWRRRRLQDPARDLLRRKR